MLRRNLNSDFVGGAYVFPGGGSTTPTRSAAQSLAWASRTRRLERLGLERAALRTTLRACASSSRGWSAHRLHSARRAGAFGRSDVVRRMTATPGGERRNDGSSR